MVVPRTKVHDPSDRLPLAAIMNEMQDRLLDGLSAIILM